MGSGHSKMPCASSGTGMLLNKPYIKYRIESNRFGLVIFPLVWISRKLFTLFEH